jgi:aconitate hydratase
LGLSGREWFDIIGIAGNLAPFQEMTVQARNGDGTNKTTFKVIARLDTPVEVDYYRNGGVLHTILRRMAESEAS